MTTFRYKGQTAGGAKVSGVLRAYDEFEAADKLRESVAIITKLEAVPEKKESVLSRPVAFRVKEKELALLCSQFTIVLHLADGGDSDCRLVLTLRENKADPTVSTVSGGGLWVRDVTTTTTTISWSPDNATIEKEAVVSKS